MGMEKGNGGKITIEGELGGEGRGRGGEIEGRIWRREQKSKGMKRSCLVLTLRTKIRTQKNQEYEEDQEEEEDGEGMKGRKKIKDQDEWEEEDKGQESKRITSGFLVQTLKKNTYVQQSDRKARKSTCFAFSSCINLTNNEANKDKLRKTHSREIKCKMIVVLLLQLSFCPRVAMPQ